MDARPSDAAARGTSDPDTSDPTGRRLPAGWLLSAVALLLVALLAGLVVGSRSADALPRVQDPVDVGFLQDMKTHHAQAVRMSALLHRRTTDPDLAALSLDVLTTQQGQIGIMTGWLELWEQAQTNPGEVMAWMGDEHAGHMPGMASEAELRALETMPPAQLSEQYLRLMIRHHRGAVPMAEHAAREAESPQVARLAQKMATGQDSEIEAMQDLLRARGHAPEPEEDAAHH